MRLAIIGPGNVGRALARGWVSAGHDVILGVRNAASSSALAAAKEIPTATVESPTEAAAHADAVVLTVPFAQAVETALGLGDLKGRVLVDCTNPVGPNLTHGLGSRQSGSAQLQEALPGVHVVKAFSIYGFEVLGGQVTGASAETSVNADSSPTMMIAGDDADALQRVKTLAADLGFDPLHVGGLEAALQLEHMTLLWVRMVRAGGHPTDLAWYRR